MVAIAHDKPETIVLPEPTFSEAALRELGGSLRVIAKIRFRSQIEPLIAGGDYGEIPGEAAVLNHRAIATNNGTVFAAYHVFGTVAMDDVGIHVLWTLGPDQRILIRLATESVEAQ